MEKSVIPNFFIIGAARSGTSSFYEYLKQHPDIFLSTPKEPMYFAFPSTKVEFKGPGDDKEINRKAVTNLDAYLDLFKAGEGKAIRGEASANYLYSECAAKNIQALSPDAKLVAVLRNPIDRAYSSYLYTLRDGREQAETFEEALELEESRIQGNWEHLWHYREMGFYFHQLQRYYRYFDRSQIKIILQEDLKDNTEQVVKETFEFLGVDATFKPEIGLAYNQGGKPKNVWLNKMLTRPSKVKSMVRPLTPRFLLEAYIDLKHKNLAKPEMSEETKTQLMKVYRRDIESLEGLIDRDLACWS